MPLSKDPLTDSTYFRFDTYYPWLCLIAAIVGGFATFLLPYFLHFSAVESNISMTQYLKVLHPDSELTKAVETDQFKMALLFSVAIAIPISFDTVLDCAYPIIHPEERLLWYSKFMLLISTTLPNFILLVGNFGPFQDDAFIIGFYFTRIAVSGFTMAYTSQVALNYQMKEISTKCVTVVMLGVAAYALCSFSNFLIHPIDQIVHAASSFIRLGAHFFFINALVSWYRIAHPGGEAISYCEMIILVKLAAVFCCNNLIAVTSFYYNAYDDRNASSDCICRYIYIQMIYTVIVMTIPGRISRLEVNYATRAMKERQAFIRYISHEIRTPLNTVFLGLEFVTSALKKIPTQRGDNSVQPVIDTVDDIYSSCEIAMSILNDLLTFDKMEGGKMNLELEYVNCCDYMGSLAKPFNVNARDKQIAFSINLEDVSSDFEKNAYVKVDHSKMGQVVRNLISNALKFTPDGGTVTVAVSHVKINISALDSLSSDSFDAEKSGLWPFRGSCIPVQAVLGVRDVLRVEVRDTGAGISTINQTKLFGQYVQFNANKLQKGSGSGLGLWISKGITELHGGCIGAYSEGEGKGSTFYLELPVTFLNIDDSGRVYSRSNSTSGSAHCTPPSGRRMKPKKNRSSSTDLSERTAYSGGELDDVTLTDGIFAHLCNKTDSMPNTPKSSATCTPYPASSPMLIGRYDARSEELIRCGSCKSVEGSENYFSSGEEAEADADADCDDDNDNDNDNNIEVISEIDVENVTKEKFRIVMNHQLMEKLKKVRHAPPPYSGTSSISSQSSSKTESSSLYGLSELLKKSITGSGTESSSYARKDSIDFLSSAHPFMVTSIPFMQSINSSRGSLNSSKFQSRYPSISNTPRCASPRLANSDKSTPTATGQSTPYFNSPHVSPRGSVIGTEPWMKAPLSHSTSKIDNLEPRQEKDMQGGSFSWRECEHKMTCTTLRPERQGAGVGRKLKRAGSTSDCASELAPLIQPQLLRPRAPDGVGVRAESFQSTLNLNGIAGQAVDTIKVTDSPKGHVKEQVSKAGESLHFLIVDDVLMNRRMVHRLLSSYNFQISEAKDGKDCMRVVDAVEAQGSKIDVVLMDNCMPVMTGPEAASAMRAKGYRGVIIGVTGHAQASDIEQFKKCGANAVLAKPLKFEVLTTLVRDLLAAKEKEKS